MIRIAALNDSSAGSSDEEDIGPTREALEAAATKCYKDAIMYMAKEELSKAEKSFQEVLENPCIEKVCPSEDVDTGGILPQDLALKYSCYKNLGNMAMKNSQYDKACQQYLQAVQIDGTEVTLWQRLGAAAIKLHDFELALVAFQEGLNVNPNHWPCVDQLLSVVFILRMYIDCLGLCINTLQRDPGYIKALAFKDKIFEQQPSLMQDIKYFFKDSSLLFKKVEYDKAKGDKFITVCESLRQPHKTPQKIQEAPMQCFKRSLASLTWSEVALSLLETYDHLVDQDAMDFIACIDVIESMKPPAKESNCPEEQNGDALNPKEKSETSDRTSSGKEENEEPRFEMSQGTNGALHEGREMLRKMEGEKIRDAVATSNTETNLSKISSRRQTIELGESQDSFRVECKSDDTELGTLQDQADDSQTDDNKTEKISKCLSLNEPSIAVFGSQEELSEKEHNKNTSDSPAELFGPAKLVKPGDDKDTLDSERNCVEISITATESVQSEVVSKPEFSAKSKVLSISRESLAENTTAEETSETSDNEHEVDGPSPSGDMISSMSDQEGDNNVEKELEKEPAVKVTDTGETDPSNSGTPSQGNEKTLKVGVDMGEAEKISSKDDLEQPGEENLEKNKTQTLPNSEEDQESMNINEIDNMDMELCPEDDMSLTGFQEQSEETEATEDSQTLRLTETEAAVNTLQNIMGLQAPGEILGLPETDYHFETEFEEEEYDYFDGGVFEEEDMNYDITMGISISGEVTQDRDGEESADMEGDEDIHIVDEIVDQLLDSGLAVEQEVNENGCEVEVAGGDMEEVAGEVGQAIGEGEDEDVGVSGEEIEEDVDIGDVSGEEDNGGDETRDGDEEDVDEDALEGIEGDEEDVEEGKQSDGRRRRKNSELDKKRSQLKRKEDGRAPTEKNKLDKSTKDKERSSEEEDGIAHSKTWGKSNDNTDTLSKNAKTMHRSPERRESEEFHTDTDKETADESSVDRRKEDRGDGETLGDAGKSHGVVTHTSVHGFEEQRKRTKRTKRGLERELEQLDYWGRRQARDAKRRKRSLPSKLVGVVEETDFMSWTDLLRSFLPSSLSKNKSRETRNQSKTASSLVNQRNACPLLSVEKKKQSAPMSDGGHISKESEGVETEKKQNDHKQKDQNAATAEAPTGKENEDVKKSSDGVKDNLKEINGVSSKEEGETVDKTEGKKELEEEKAEDNSKNALVVTLAEDEEVKNFLMRHQKNGGVLDLLTHLLDFFILKFKYVWPPDIAKLFTNIYSRVRKHFCHGAALCLTEDENRLKRESWLALTNLELLVSLHLVSKHGSSSVNQENSIVMNDLLEDDMIHLRLMEGRGDIWKEDTLSFCTRLSFIQAQLHLSRGDPDNAFIYLEQLQYDLKRMDKEFEKYELNRVHVESDTLIVTFQEVSKQLLYLQRSQNLEQVVNYYTEGQYQLVAELIVALFHETLPKPRPGISWPSRQTQLAIMVDSHLKLGNLKDVIKWGSLALTESVETYNKTEDETQKGAWTNAIAKILDTMHKAVFDLKHGTMDDIIPEQRKSLASTLIHILVMQLDEPHSSDDVPFNTLSPWVIMHRVLVEEEKRNEEKKQSGEGESPETNSSSNSSSQESDDPVDKPSHSLEAVSAEVLSKEEDGKENKGDDKEESKSSKEGTVTLYPSTLFLVTAHDHLGKHSWCCQNEGRFLLYCMDVFLEELQRPLEEQHHQTLYQALEQTTFCLYSHPSKKSKHKHLKDHGVNQIPLSLDRGLQLYKYYLPKEIPEFQSSQIPSIADDVAALFKRLRPLLPQSRMEERRSHMTESTEEKTQEEEGQSVSNVNPPILKDYYYLLGDYFFKNKEWESAVTYYKLDVINNPDRIDSWAPMALAPKAQLETELNSCDVIEDDKFFDQALQAVKCFQKALELDMYHSNLWVEFGGLVYMVHSHASRLLKQDLNPDISMEMFERLEKIKVDMLAQAQICFKRANEIMEEGWDDEELPDERWLHQYMLGKVAEKQGMNPEVILNHYIQAAKHLHNIHARYPHKINYNNPQENAVEALEMYYRVHAYILKYLHQRDGKSVDPSIVKLFTKVLNEVVRQPFALFQENNKRGKDIIEEKEVHKEAEIIEDKDDEDRDIIADPESLRDPLELTEADRRNLKRPLEDAEDIAPPAKRGSAEVIAPVIEEMITCAMDHSQEKEKTDEQKKVTQDGGSETEKGGGKPKSGECETDKESLTKKGGQEKDVEKQAIEEKKDSDQEIEVVAEVNKKQCEELVTRCLMALKECLARFPQHYKSLYRLAHYYHLSKQHKDNSKARNYLLGCDYYQRVPYMPVNGLFHEKRIWPQNPRNCNLFHGVWRVPNDEIDRPGSFAAHMYRSVSLVLDVLPYLKDFYSILEIALALKNSPEKDKKYLRDNERELLCEHATQVGLQTMKDKFAVLFKGSSPVHGNRRLAFVIDVYRGFKQLSRHLPHTEDQLGKMLQDAYKAFKGGRIDGRVNVMREAEMFCSKNLNFVRRPTPPMPLVGLHNNPSLSSTPFYNTQGRRGRPPGSSRYRGGRGRGVYYGSGMGTAESLGVQHAYRTYENMLQVQAALNRKTCTEADAQKHRRQLQQYQEELLRYWQIPGVAQYFQTALQNVNSSGSKLSANTPSAILSTLRQQQQTTSTHFRGGSNLRPSLSALASKSKEHGISITSVSSKRPIKFGSNPRPRLSVTVTPTKQGQPSVPRPLHGREDISVMPVQRSGAGPKELVSSSVSLTPLPKLPAGTTLSRPHETSPKAGPAKPMQSSPLQGQTRMAHPGQRLPYSPMKQRPVNPQSPLARSSQSTTSPSRGRSQGRGIQDYRAQIQNPNVSVVSLGRDMQQKQQQGLPRSITLTHANRSPGRGLNVAIRSRGNFNRGRPGGMDYTKSFMTAARGMNPTQRGGGPRMTAQVRPLDPAQLMKLASGSAKPGNLTGMNMLSRPRGEAPRGRGQIRPPLARPQQPQPPANTQSNKQSADDIIILD